MRDEYIYIYIQDYRVNPSAIVYPKTYTYIPTYIDEEAIDRRTRAFGLRRRAPFRTQAKPVKRGSSYMYAYIYAHVHTHTHTHIHVYILGGYEQTHP